MNRLLAHAMVIARRDFVATVFTPTFLLFLLAPFFMIGFGLVGGLGAAQMATSANSRAEIAAIASGVDAERLRAADRAMRATYTPEGQPAEFSIVAPERDPAAQARALLDAPGREVFAVLYGPLDRPTILRDASSRRSAPYLAELAEQALRTERLGAAGAGNLSTPRIESLTRAAPRGSDRQGIGFAAVFTMFLLTLLLAGQTVGMLAEEKGNKVIEILAAAVPLEAVFLGKLIGMFGVALLFVGFWAALGASGFSAMPGMGLSLSGAAPAIGLPLFVLLVSLYFTMAFLLLGAVFLGVGAQASTVREIQMLSLPITIFQVAMFGLALGAAGAPGTPIAFVAEIFPFSSPFAMAARAANDASLWPHFAALAWQLLWVSVTIVVAARLFRRGVLKSGSGPGWFSKRAGEGEVGEPVVDTP